MKMKRKQNLKRTLVLLAALLCLVGVMPAMYVQAIDLAPGPVAVKLASGQENWAEDIEAAGVVLDFYQIAKADNSGVEADSFKFVLNEAFSEVDLTKEALEIAQAAADAARSASPAVSGKKLEAEYDLEPGLYLMVVHGTDPGEKSKYIKTGETGIYTVANSTKYEYQFNPQLISVPTKAQGANSNTADQGAWIGVEGNPLTIVLKASREQLGTAKYDPPVYKFVQGPCPKGSVFTFAMTPDQKDAPMPENPDARLDEATGALYLDRTDPGEYEFGWMYFDWTHVGKTYTYTLREIPGSDANFTYDVKIYTMTIVVSGEDRQVKLDISYKDETGASVDKVTFTNIYEEPPAPPTGDTTNLRIWIIIMSVCVVALGAVLFIAKKRKT